MNSAEMSGMGVLTAILLKLYHFDLEAIRLSYAVKAFESREFEFLAQIVSLPLPIKPLPPVSLDVCDEAHAMNAGGRC